jgi:hypothetical protein
LWRLWLWGFMNVKSPLIAFSDAFGPRLKSALGRLEGVSLLYA